MAAEQQEQASGGALRNGAEFVAYLMVVGFLYLCWPPLALLGGGAVLWLWANFTSPRKGRLVRALGAAFGAASRAWRESTRGAR